MKIDPRHPHLLIEWPTASGGFWRFRIGYRWDANARAYIFPALALKKVDGPMPEYQKDARRRIAGTHGGDAGNDGKGQSWGDKPVPGPIMSPTQGSDEQHAQEKT